MQGLRLFVEVEHGAKVSIWFGTYGDSREKILVQDNIQVHGVFTNSESVGRKNIPVKTKDQPVVTFAAQHWWVDGGDRAL